MQYLPPRPPPPHRLRRVDRTDLAYHSGHPVPGERYVGLEVLAPAALSQNGRAPMDLATCAARLQGDAYARPPEFFSDAALIWANCRMLEPHCQLIAEAQARWPGQLFEAFP